MRNLYTETFEKKTLARNLFVFSERLAEGDVGSAGAIAERHIETRHHAVLPIDKVPEARAAPDMEPAGQKIAPLIRDTTRRGEHAPADPPHNGEPKSS
jgi:hypothetical protein